MIKEERINHSIAKKRVNKNINDLLSSKRRIEDIFNISFRSPNFTLFNIVKWNSLTEISYETAKKRINDYSIYFSQIIPSAEKYVGLLLENCAEWVYSMYGLLMAGFKPILLSTAADENEINEIIEKLNAKYIVTNRNVCVTSIDPFNVPETNTEKVGEWENEIIFITSGTSGKPKIISYTGEELTEQIVNAAGILRDYPLIASSYNGYLKHLLILPLYHVFGFIAVFLWFSFFNITFVIPTNLTPDKIKEACIIGESTHIFAVPLFWDTIVKKIERVVKENNAEKKFNKALNLSISLQKIMHSKNGDIAKNILFSKYIDGIFGKSIQFCITGGSSISERTLKVINALGYPLVNGYGSTEIGISSLSNPKTLKGRMDVSIGKPFDNFEYMIDNNNELLVKGKSSCHATYTNNNWVVRNKDDFINTNDSARVIKNNYYLDGRLDEFVINKNGENFSLANIEQKFKPTFADDVVALEDEDNTVSLLVSFRENISEYLKALEIKKIIENSAYTKFKIKNIYLTNKSIPKANGLKIKRHLMMEMLKNNEFTLANLEELSKTNEITLNEEILSQVINIFLNVSGCDSINKDSDFFNELSGDSLSYYELVANLEAYFGIKFDIEKHINRTPTQFTIEIMENIND